MQCEFVSGTCNNGQLVTNPKAQIIVKVKMFAVQIVKLHKEKNDNRLGQAYRPPS